MRFVAVTSGPTGIAFAMLVPILAGFIAFAIADRPGLLLGALVGLMMAFDSALAAVVARDLDSLG